MSGAKLWSELHSDVLHEWAVYGEAGDRLIIKHQPPEGCPFYTVRKTGEGFNVTHLLNTIADHMWEVHR